MNIILFDTKERYNFLPFAYTRPIAEIIIGMSSIGEKWSKSYKGAGISYLTEKYLSRKFPAVIDPVENLIINGSLLPSDEILDEINELDFNEKLMDGEDLLAIKLSGDKLTKVLEKGIRLDKVDVIKTKTKYEAIVLKKWTDIFLKNDIAIDSDYRKLTAGRSSSELSASNTLIGNNIFVEPDAIIEGAILNSSTGPIYIGRNVQVMEGAMIRGPVAICENSVIKMGAKIYGATTFGPYSKVGGEVNNCVIFGFSNKAHDGFIGNTVIGEWCNLGADTNISNLKNNYTSIKLWEYQEKSFKDSGLQFCGMAMGDHSKTGINTMINTGTTVGVSANLYGSGYPRNFIPSFSWGGREGLSVFKLDKAIDVARTVMQRRNVELTKKDIEILDHIYTTTADERSK